MVNSCFRTIFWKCIRVVQFQPADIVITFFKAFFGGSLLFLLATPTIVAYMVIFRISFTQVTVNTISNFNSSFTILSPATEISDFYITLYVVYTVCWSMVCLLIRSCGYGRGTYTETGMARVIHTTEVLTDRNAAMEG